jgi:hypothetical protein
MLELIDTLWNKLDDAHRDEHIPTVLSSLAASWDETASEFLYGTFWYQGSCYGATYAVIPHLLRIAGPEENRHQRPGWLASALEAAFRHQIVPVSGCEARRRHSRPG